MREAEDPLRGGGGCRLPAAEIGRAGAEFARDRAAGWLEPVVGAWDTRAGSLATTRCSNLRVAWVATRYAVDMSFLPAMASLTTSVMPSPRRERSHPEW